MMSNLERAPLTGGGSPVRLPDTLDQAEKPSMQDVMDAWCRQERRAAELAALVARLQVQLRQQRASAGLSLAELLDIRHFPESCSDRQFSAREVMKLPEDPAETPIVLLDSRREGGPKKPWVSTKTDRGAAASATATAGARSP